MHRMSPDQLKILRKYVKRHVKQDMEILAVFKDSKPPSEVTRLLTEISVSTLFITLTRKL